MSVLSLVAKSEDQMLAGVPYDLDMQSQEAVGRDAILASVEGLQLYGTCAFEVYV